MAIAVSGSVGAVVSTASPLVSSDRLRKAAPGASSSSPYAAALFGSSSSGGGRGLSPLVVARMNNASQRRSAGAPRKAAEHFQWNNSKTTYGENGSRRVGPIAASSSSPIYNEALADKQQEEGGGNGFGGPGGGGGGGGDGGGDGGDSASEGSEGSGDSKSGIFGALLRGWDSRVKTDPQFPFKVLMEQIVGVGACVIGDMASRPNYGLNELDLVFSTLVVGSILNLALMYMLAPTAAAGSVTTKLPGIFANSPTAHMFESGSYSLMERLGTFVFKGSQFAVVGLFAGLAGTGLTNGLIKTRQKLDPDYTPQSPSPPLALNSFTWAIQMGISSNFRYQALNGIEFKLFQTVSPSIFKVSVPVLRAVNNVLGGTTFVVLARLTGSQPKAPPPQSAEDETSTPLEHAVDTS